MSTIRLWPVVVAILCWSVAAAAQPPNIVFILVDDLRWDEIGAAGHPTVRTPHIDRLAREGALFPNAFVTTPLCSPSRASFLTGQYARTHGIIDNTNRSAASHRLTTFPLLLQRAGYETAFVGYQSVRTERWKYIRYRELHGMDELYDLSADPYELHNLIAAPAHGGQIKQLQRELDRLLTGSK